MFMAIAAVASVAVGVGSAVAQHQGASSAAKKSNAASAAQRAQDLEYNREVREFQTGIWAEDIAFAQETLDYSRGEFTRQTEWAGVAAERIQRNRDNDAYTLAVRGIEETIARTLQGTRVAREGTAARATFANKERGVEGNSVEAVLNDVKRQEGDAQVFLDMNLDSTRRQLGREGVAMDAQADQQIAQLASALRTFTPSAPIRAPSPDPQVRPAQTVNGPSTASLAGGLFNSATSGLQTYNTLSGQNARQTYDQFTGWASRQFSFGGTPAGA